MKHSIRINGQVLHGQVLQFDCELGSGVLDKNGIEIFEGDIVRYNNEPKAVLPVVLERGIFALKSPNIYIGLIELNIFKSADLEVIGHIAEGQS